MPNFCEVDVVIKFNDQQEYAEFVRIADIDETTDHYLSFNSEERGYGLFDRFDPTPQEFLADERWHKWRRTSWGTKWNPIIHEFEHGDGQVILRMNTAWSPPREFFETLHKMFPSTVIKMDYLEEGMMYCGKCEILDGETYDRYINNIPAQAYVELGAVLDKDGDVDWDKSEDIDPAWTILENEEMFERYYRAKENANWISA